MHDLAILGSGFGGSLLASIARQLGRSVLLIEKASHPRFAIGESSTPLADLLWLELTARYGLSTLAPFAKWGTWREAHPEVACGLKRGFTFYHHALGHPFAARPDRSDQLIVAASPRDAVADTHWYRPDFDHFLVREAARLGAEYVDECDIEKVGAETSGVRLEGRRRRQSVSFEARFVVDASQRRGPIARSMQLRDIPLPHLPPTQALYTHFEGVVRLGDLPIEPGAARAPYAVDDAAVHHVFEGGWIWVLRFVNGITSAGVAAVASVANRLVFADGAPAWHRLLKELPTVGRQFAPAHAVRPFVYAPGIAFCTEPLVGGHSALLPSAAGFVDPLLSSGFTLTLLGIERLAAAMETAWERRSLWEDALARHAAETFGELLAIEEFVSALYARMGDFAAFTEIARLYFCAVIYCETARRLGRPAVAGGYLMRNHPVFGPAAKAVCRSARDGVAAADLRRQVDALLADFDLGGLADPDRRPWYPVFAADLRSGRDRIGASTDEIEALLNRAGF